MLFRSVVRMPDKELGIVNDRDMPDISVQNLLAVMLIDGNVTFESAHDYARVRDARVKRLRKRIEAVGDATLTDPDRRWRAAMEITLRDGRVLSHQTMAAKGGVDSPQSAVQQVQQARATVRQWVCQWWDQCNCIH